VADRISSLRKIRIGPLQWRRSVGATSSRSSSTTTAGTDYTQMEAVQIRQSDPVLVFQFPFPPERVSYSEMAPEMVSIDRPGRKPLVLFSKPRAKRVTISFIVAVPNDGMFIDVEDSLEVLQEIAGSTRPLVFTNTDGFLGAPGSYSGGELAFWTVMDLQFDSIRRNAGQRIAQAQVTMSLIENVNPLLEIVQLEPIQYTEIAPFRNPENEDEEAEDWIDFTDIAIGGGDRIPWVNLDASEI